MREGNSSSAAARRFRRSESREGVGLRGVLYEDGPRSPKSLPRQRRGRVSGALLGVVLLGGMLAAGCSASHEATPSPTPRGAAPAPSASSSTVRPSPERTSTGDVVNDGYVFFWQAFINAQTNWDPDSPELARHASGQALAYAREAVRAARTEGWVRVVKDGFQINSRVIQRQGDTARVSDFQDWSKWPLVVGNSDEVVPGSTPRQCITAGMVLRGGTWIVDTLTFAPNTC